MIRPAPRAAPGGLARSLATSATVHVLVVGVGVVWGLLAGAGQSRTVRAWEATFVLTEERPADPVERLEPVLPPSEVAEADLLESELWAEQADAFLEEPELAQQPTAPAAVDWFTERTLTIGSLEPAPRESEPEPAALEADAVARVEEVPAPAVAEPVALVMPAPAYPRLSRRRGEEGTVLCRLKLAASGEVLAVKVVESSGHERLDAAARETLATWRFAPCRVDGLAVSADYLHRVTFRLDS